MQASFSARALAVRLCLVEAEVASIRSKPRSCLPSVLGRVEERAGSRREEDVRKMFGRRKLGSPSDGRGARMVSGGGGVVVSSQQPEDGPTQVRLNRCW